jgi:transposase
MPILQTLIDAEAGAAVNGVRRTTIVAAPAPASPELSDRPRRRTFIAKDKLSILADIDRAAETRGICAILRREGLYSSTLSEWRRQRDAGAFSTPVPGKRGPSTSEPNPLSAEVAALQQKGDISPNPRTLRRGAKRREFSP